MRAAEAEEIPAVRRAGRGRGLRRAESGPFVEWLEVASHPREEKMDVGFGVQIRVTSIKCSVSPRRFHGWDLLQGSYYPIVNVIYACMYRSLCLTP